MKSDGRTALACTLLSVFVAACASSRSRSGAPPSVEIHAYTSPALGADGAVNCYFVETAHGIVVVDGLRTLHEARDGLVALQRLGKPVIAVILTHPHPDHVGGLPVFLAAGKTVPLYASSATRDELANDTQGLFALSAKMLADDFPAHVPAPTNVVASGTTVTLDGVAFAFTELGAGESLAATVVGIPDARAAIVGDVIQDRMTAFLVEGRSAKWLAQLDGLQALLAQTDRVYPGHGRDGTPAETIGRERDYLQTFRASVQRLAPRGSADPAAHAAITAELGQRFPSYPAVATIPMLLDKDIDAVAKELAPMP